MGNPRSVHIAGGLEPVGLGVENLGGVFGSPLFEASSGDQHPAVVQEGGRVILSRHSGFRKLLPCISFGVVYLGAAELLATVSEDSSIVEEGQRESYTPGGHDAARRPLSGCRIVNLRLLYRSARAVSASGDENATVMQAGGPVGAAMELEACKLEPVLFFGVVDFDRVQGAAP